MEKPREGLEGYASMFLVSSPAILLDLFVAGLTLREAIAARGMFVLLKVALGGKYALAREHLVVRATVHAIPKPRLAVDAALYPLFIGGLYSIVLLVLNARLEDALWAIALNAGGAVFAGPLVGIVIDAFKRLFLRLTSRAP